MLPPHFLKAKQTALLRTVDYDPRARPASTRLHSSLHNISHDPRQPNFANNDVQQYQSSMASNETGYYNPEAMYESSAIAREDNAIRFRPPSPRRQVESQMHSPDVPPNPQYPLDVNPRNPPVMDIRRVDGHRAIETDEFDDRSVPMDEAVDVLGAPTRGFDPPEDEPPSLKKINFPSSQRSDGLEHIDTQYYVTPTDEEPRSPVTDDFVSPVSVGTYDEPTPSPSMGRPPKKSEVDVSKSTSPAMRGAQEMLRRNRQRRSLETAKKKDSREGRKETIATENPDDEINIASTAAETPKSPESGATWESGSEVTSLGGSSTWTDDNGPDRSSRRALILQMAKARMRNNQQHRVSSIDTPTTEESREMEEEEKKNDVGHPDDIDLTSDLD